MSRHRWYEVRWPTRIRDIAAKLERWPFREEASDGFLVDRVREGYIEGRFIERMEVSNQTVNPFGEKLSFNRVEFRQSRFRLSKSSPGLEISGPAPGSIRLINKVAELNEYRVSISDLRVDIFDWLERFKERAGCSGFIDIIQVGQLRLGGTVSARAIVRGKEDVRSAAERLTGSLDSVVEKIQFRPTGSMSGSVVLSRLGSITVRSKDDDEVVGHLRQALEDIEATKDRSTA
ncbi:hypothetical protein [Xanthobacter flavus]|uniref:hypothetical protein n=1 Tax=Xanthobacter flavus TaxID=281 RepID=UPI0037279070